MTEEEAKEAFLPPDVVAGRKPLPCAGATLFEFGTLPHHPVPSASFYLATPYETAAPWPAYAAEKPPGRW